MQVKTRVCLFITLPNINKSDNGQCLQAYGGREAGGMLYSNTECHPSEWKFLIFIQDPSGNICLINFMLRKYGISTERRMTKDDSQQFFIIAKKEKRKKMVGQGGKECKLSKAENRINADTP